MPKDREPSPVEVQATCVADGFSRGCIAGDSPVVNRRARVPRSSAASLSEASQTASCAVNVMRSRETCG
jgi:hypothetical protein